jgi:hypothetical protein
MIHTIDPGKRTLFIQGGILERFVEGEEYHDRLPVIPSD